MSRIHYPRTTVSQRRLLFETWEKTKDVAKACRIARVSERTFYYWKPRFETGGYEVLKQFASPAPQVPHRTAATIEQEVIALRRQNGRWGKRRIADELGKKNNWIAVISPNTVKRILQEAGLWPQPQSQSTPPKFEPVSRTAERPGQSLNVDLCFVPAKHEAEAKLPAVSGSSGRLVVERVKSEAVEPDYPGTVFADEQLDYTQAMTAFVAASKAKDEEAVASPKVAHATEKLSGPAQKRLLRQQETTLALERSQIRARRQQEDAAWQALRSQRQAQQAARKQPFETGTCPAWGSKKAQDEQWRQLRAQRCQQLNQRQQEDEIWRQKRLDLRAGLANLGLITCWMAVLVVVDNCTRQCLALPLFVTGPNLTADMVVEALQVLLPPELQFLITDRGTHFTANIFDQLAEGREFIHVLIARHRPQSNGIAERFVRTLKEWLADKSWQSDQELAQLLAQFIAEYNDRPHLGLPTPGLSPNEFANRVWLM
ncbi:MAG: integrase core domain-containing protein [Anaerolineae bacterium]